MSQIEVLSNQERRRYWSTEQKRSIVVEAFAPGASVREVARRMDVVPSLIYRWRRELRSAAMGFAEVVVAPGADQPMAMGLRRCAATYARPKSSRTTRVPVCREVPPIA